MPSVPRPKYVALRDFKQPGYSFKTGDPITGLPDGRLPFLVENGFIGTAPPAPDKSTTTNTTKEN